MNDNQFPNTKRTEQWVFLLSLGSAVYWGLGDWIDIYRIAAVGAVYELLWLPFLALLLGLPAVSFFLWAKGKIKLDSLFFYAFGISSILLGWRILS